MPERIYNPIKTMGFSAMFTFELDNTKGQLISKRNSQAEDSPKKRTNEFVFTSMRRVFVRFLGESSARKKSFRDYLTFKNKITFSMMASSIF